MKEDLHKTKKVSSSQIFSHFVIKGIELQKLQLNVIGESTKEHCNQQ